MQEGIALYGLTADPVHNGHLRVATAISSLSFITDTYIHVAYQPEYKKPIATFEQRHAMANRAFVQACVMDSKHKYTSEVVRELRKDPYDGPIYFFTGLEWKIDKFHDAKYLVKNVIQIMVPDASFYCTTRMIENRLQVSRLPSIRSTDIRRLIQEGDFIDGLVPECVLKYIKYKELYGYK